MVPTLSIIRAPAGKSLASSLSRTFFIVNPEMHRPAENF
jgi:hypothetical protein